ncbi:DUF1385 domain-containing protein [Paucisalibacillus globulus]|uniref:DUF1385 domain-containing protein n=1 Tax=Paucisalibacillus globulus TaxID=351095 RepID=UPI000407AC6A|nr:DUF1385 domain-containing protein [Paucisalibacillus globulus]
MEIYGGRAGFNSVSFTSEKYESLTRFKDSKIITEISLRKGNRGITNILLKIPFVRSFSLLIEIVIDYWKRFLIVVVPLFLFNLYVIKESTSTSLFVFPINTLEMLFIFLILAGLMIKITPIGKYHAAEHMVANAYEMDSDLTLEMVKKQPRTHRDCGTNLVISIFICFCILFLFFGGAKWVLLVSWSIGYELW